MMPRPIRPTRLPVSSNRSNAPGSGGRLPRRSGQPPAISSRNSSPALRDAFSIIPSAHSATPYDDPLVVSTTRTPRALAASTSIRAAKRSPSSSPMIRRSLAPRPGSVSEIRGLPWQTISAVDLADARSDQRRRRRDHPGPPSRLYGRTGRCTQASRSPRTGEAARRRTAGACARTRPTSRPSALSAVDQPPLATSPGPVCGRPPLPRRGAGEGSGA